MRLFSFAAFGLCLAVPLAQAHVSLEQKTAVAGSYQKLTFRVGHGCEGSATTSITVTLPEAIASARAMPKPGWTIITGNPREIAWKGGPLADSQIDEFNLLVKLPETAGSELFKVVQLCEKGRADWVEAPGSAGKFPAPLLDVLPGVLPAAPSAGSATTHHH